MKRNRKQSSTAAGRPSPEIIRKQRLTAPALLRLFRSSFAVPGFLILGLAIVAYDQSNHLGLFLDEGIYLFGAQRLLSGQRPYLDWFVFTGPGTFWLFAALFKVFHTSLLVAHSLLTIEIALIAGSVYWAIANQIGKLAALAASVSFVAILLSIFSYRLYINHRWDSTCCVAIAISVLLTNDSNLLSLIAGVCGGLAVVFTPPAALVVIALVVGLLVTPERKKALFFGAGALVPLTLTATILWWQGALGPMMSSFQWASQHYQRANSVPYGFEAMLSQAGSEPFHNLIIAIPAALPVVAFALICLLLYQRMEISPTTKLLLLASVGSVLSCYPRWAANQLLFTVPVLLCLLALLVSKLVSGQALRNGSIGLLAFSLVAVVMAVGKPSPATVVKTELGSVLCTARDQPNIEFATATVQPQESLFVYPYQPIWYSVTGGVNPTSYDFLQPGMMTLADEGKVLAQLEAHPPQWVIWHNLSPRTVLAFWPNSNRETLHFARIEFYIRTHYAQVRPPDPGVHYAIAIFGRLRTNS